MSRTENREKIVFDLLKGLRGEKELRELCGELNYKFCKAELSTRNWSSAAAQKLVEEKHLAAPVLLANAGHDGDFKIIYTRLHSDDLRLGYERQIVTQLLHDHPYALFIFSNDEQDRWHFVNVKYHEQSKRHSRVFRRIAVGGHDRLHTAAKRLAMLDLDEKPESLSPLKIQKAHDDAFDVEAVTETFFRGDARTGEKGYKQVFDDLQQALYKQTRDRVWAHDYALQFLNRIMFLYFIQRKRWLGDEPEFLRAFWKSYRANETLKDTFASRWLNVLFFEAFNRPHSERRGGFDFLPPNLRAAVQQAPFLNGGLFKPNDLDEAQGCKFLLNDALFEQAFKFFERYNFTVSEISPLDQEVAVDAEMLSKVYESLVNVSVEANEQGDIGTFYTPRTEIDLMCRLALVDNFANHLGNQHKAELYAAVFALEEDEKTAADEALTRARLWEPFDAHLRQLAILDPACGSGSFLIGMMYLLHDLQARADHGLGKKEEEPFQRKKRIVTENLYGVDAMKWITQVTELGLWLNLAVGAPLTRAELQHRNEPLLPNLNCRVRRGDSLVQEVSKLDLKHRRYTSEVPEAVKTQIENLRQEKRKFYYSEEGGLLHSEKDARRYEHRSVLAVLQAWEEALPERLKTLPQREPIHADLENIRRTRTALKNVDEEAFVWDRAFAEVFLGGKNGFDIVIGNPPYVRQEKIADPRLPSDEITKENKQAYKAELARSVYQAFPVYFGYKPAKGSAARKLGAKSDLYVYFYFHALSLLNPRGSFCFITSNSWLDVGYGAELQEFLLKHCHVKMIIDNQVMRVFAQADVNTIIALFSAPDETREWGPEQTARFVMFKQPFENVATAETFQQIESINERQATPDFRIHPAQQQVLLTAGSEGAQGSQTCATGSANLAKSVSRKSDFAHTGPLIKVERYPGDKWGGKYLRAPDIYWTILKKGKDKLVRLGDIAEVRRGFTTGANKFFYLNEARIREWGIEKEFLKPVIKSPRECKRILIDPKDLKYKIFMCHKDKKDLKGTAALEYIKWGETERFHKRPSCAGRAKWWDLGERRYAPIISPCGVSELPRTFKNAGVFADKRLYEIYPTDQENAILLGANATVCSLFFEIGSRTGLGEGLLDLTVYELADCPIALLQESVRVEKILAETIQRDILTFRDELQHPNRKALDSVIFDALNLTHSERDSVYEAVIDLVGSRLKRAESTNPKKRQAFEDDEE